MTDDEVVRLLSLLPGAEEIFLKKVFIKVLQWLIVLDLIWLQTFVVLLVNITNLIFEEDLQDLVSHFLVFYHESIVASVLAEVVLT